MNGNLLPEKENKMAEITAILKQCEDQIEEALWSLEVPGEIEKALEAYRAVEAKLAGLNIAPGSPAYPEQQRVLSYCLMRQGNILRQTGQPQEAFVLSEREITAARLSGDGITLARSLMSHGTNSIVGGEVKQGLAQIEEARVLFEGGDSYDHRQGLGWCWILLADIANAGLIAKEPVEVIAVADQALAILRPIENWPGVARAYAARASAYEKLGDITAAAADRESQKFYEGKDEH